MLGLNYTGSISGSLQRNADVQQDAATDADDGDGDDVHAGQ